MSFGTATKVCKNAWIAAASQRRRETIGNAAGTKPTKHFVRMLPARVAMGRRECAVGAVAQQINDAPASVSEAFERCKAAGKVAFVPFLCAGDPDLETTKEAIKILDRAGATVIELGVPYSDPLADGPTIQAAATRALSKGCPMDSVLNMLAEVSPHIKAPIVMFTYFNPIMAMGCEKFCKRAVEAGAKGLLVPDLPMEETQLIRPDATAAGLQMVLLATPVTPLERMKQIAELTEGFMYLVSVTGVTGARVSIADNVGTLVKTIKETSNKPVAVGFGISTPEHVKKVVSWGADGVIVGSALVRTLGEAPSPEEGLAAMQALTEDLVSAL